MANTVLFLAVFFLLLKAEKMTRNKSLTDEVPINSESFDKVFRQEADLCVVGNCPQCGAPIYGRRIVAAKTGDVIVRHSCDCKRTLEGTIRTT